MTVLELFEKVNLVLPLEQRRFFNYFTDTFYELCAMYPGFVAEAGAAYTPPKVLYDPNVIRPLYHNAMVDNIVYLASGAEVHKSEFIRKSREAYLTYWNENAKGRRMKKWRG